MALGILVNLVVLLGHAHQPLLVFRALLGYPVFLVLPFRQALLEDLLVPWGLEDLSHPADLQHLQDLLDLKLLAHLFHQMDLEALAIQAYQSYQVRLDGLSYQLDLVNPVGHHFLELHVLHVDLEYLVCRLDLFLLGSHARL